MKNLDGLLTDAGSLSKEISWVIQTVAVAKDEALISEICGLRQVNSKEQTEIFFLVPEEDKFCFFFSFTKENSRQLL